jgi:hypothetical protein
VRVLDAGTGDIATAVAGNAVGAETVTIPTAGLPTGTYQYALRVYKCGKPGTSETRFSDTFALGAAAGTASTAPESTAVAASTPLSPPRAPFPTLLSLTPAR